MNFENPRKPVVYFGRLTKSKGVATTVFAMTHLFSVYPSAAVPLWIIGGSYNEIEELRTDPELKEKIEQLEAHNLLFWWGQLPHDMLPYVLRKCSIFCFTSEYEPGGRTILEAMASRLPVLATPQGFAEEIIVNEENGYIVNGSAIEWAEKIYHLLSDPALCQRIGQAAYESVLTKFSMKIFYKKHWEIYQHFIPG